jgi:uncharacterized protein
VSRSSPAYIFVAPRPGSPPLARRDPDRRDVDACGPGGAIEHKDIAMLREDINNALKDAMKAQDARRVSTLRLINSALKNADIAARGEGKGPLSDDDVLPLLQKMIKQRQESIELYDKGNRPELAQQERDEIAIIAAYLPKQMSDLEAGSVISALVHEINAQGVKDMGKVMAALKQRYAGTMDFTRASAAVKKLLLG